MKIRRQITQDAEIEVLGVTLLSIEEYRENKDLIPRIDGWWWWLRSPGRIQLLAAYINDGVIHDYGISVNRDDGAVRPALKIGNPGLMNPGDKFECAGYTWTMLRGNLALCDSSIGETAFNDKDSNDYETSAVKRYVENWAMEEGILKKKMNRAERIKMLKAMEFIARNVNDESVFETWLTDGMPDGTIEYGDLTVTDSDYDNFEYDIQDDVFDVYMAEFLLLMRKAYKSGGLHCDGVLSA